MNIPNIDLSNLAGILPSLSQATVSNNNMIPGLVDLLNPKSGPGNQFNSNIKNQSWQRTAGNIMQGIGAGASFIPGVGTGVGMGLQFAGGVLKSFDTPDFDTKLKTNNQNPYGMAVGGRMPMPQMGQQAQVPGGQLNQLSSQGIEVQGNNPNQVDGVDAGNVMLDNKEMMVGDKVFTNQLTNLESGKSFAEQEKLTQKALGRFEKLKNKSGDTEFQDAKYHNKNSENLFNTQEQLANTMGLRNQDGTPVQQQEMGKKGFMWGGNKSKMKYNTGGPINPKFGNMFSNALSETAEDFRNPDPSQLMGNEYSGTFSPTPMYPINPSLGTDIASNVRSMSQDFRNVNPESLNTLTVNGLSTNVANIIPPIPPPTSVNIESRSPEVEAGPMAPVSFGSKSSKGIGIGGAGDLIDNISNILSSSKSDRPDYMSEYKYGNRATRKGDMSTSLGLLGNKPFYVGYEDVGREQINQQNIALQRARGGEQAAMNDIASMSNAALGRVSGRSVQSRNANLRNIVQGTSQQAAKTRGLFGQQEANMRQQIGQQRTGIERANLAKRMQQDDINTKEYDTALTEDLKLLVNSRNMDLERQMLYNNERTNDIYSKILKTPDFEWDGNGIVYTGSKSNSTKSKTSTETLTTKSQDPVDWRTGDTFTEEELTQNPNVNVDVKNKHFTRMEVDGKVVYKFKGQPKAGDATFNSNKKKDK